TTAIGLSLCSLYDAVRPRLARAALLVTMTAIAGALGWMVNVQPPDAGGFRVRHDRDRAPEVAFRTQLRSRIPDGDCFRFGRRIALYTPADSESPPDFTIAATGCPQLNGTRWRAFLGDNDPDSLRVQPAVSVGAGRPFEVVDETACRTPGVPGPLVAQVRGSTVELSWPGVDGASAYRIEAGS